MSTTAERMNIKQQEITNERMRKDVVALPEEPALSFSSAAGMLFHRFLPSPFT